MSIREIVGRKLQTAKRLGLLRSLTHMHSKIQVRFRRRLQRYTLGRRFTYWLYEQRQRRAGFPDASKLFEQTVGYKPNLSNPTTFNEKITYLKLFDKNPMWPTLVDKVRVRDWVAERIGHEHLIPIVGIFRRPREIDPSQLPTGFVAKLSYGSGWNILVKDKSQLDWRDFFSRLDCWHSSAHPHFLMEWYQHHIPPRIIVERLLIAESGHIPDDYKFYVIEGKVSLIMKVSDRLQTKTMTFYWSSWEQIPISHVGVETSPGPRPRNLDQMIRTAERLGRGFGFARVDLYSLKEEIFFGEITPHPASGLRPFSPSGFDEELGALIQLRKHQ